MHVMFDLSRRSQSRLGAHGHVARPIEARSAAEAKATAPFRSPDADLTRPQGQRSGLSLPEARPSRDASEARKAFMQADRNRDGAVDLEELTALLGDAELARRLLEQADANGDGRIDAAEWTDNFAALRPHLPAAGTSASPAPSGPASASGSAPGGSATAPGSSVAGPVSPAQGQQAGKNGPAVQKAIAAIQQDPGITQAFANWANLGTEEKLAVGRQISEKLGTAFGFAPAGNLRHDPGLDGTGTLGLWSSADGISLSSAALADPAQFLDTMVHEQMHQFDAADGVQDMIGPAHNSGQVQDEVYRIGRAVRDGVFGAQAA